MQAFRRIQRGLGRRSLERERDKLKAEISTLEVKESELVVGVGRSLVTHQIHGNMIELEGVFERLSFFRKKFVHFLLVQDNLFILCLPKE